MPKCLWAKARAKDSARRGVKMKRQKRRRSRPGKLEQPNGGYVVQAGTTCKVRRVDAEQWQPFVTTKECRFKTHGVADNGGTWVFEMDGWEMKVASSFVVGRARRRK